MNKIFTVFLLMLVLQAPAIASSSWRSNSPFIDAMRSMLDLFTMLQVYQQMSPQASMFGNTGQGMFSNPAQGMLNAPIQGMYADPGRYMTPYGFPGASNIPPFGPVQVEPLDGAWIGDTGILLIIRDQLARIYWSEDNHQDFYLQVEPGRIRFRDAATGAVQEFGMARSNDRLALKSKDGQVALFRKRPYEFQ